MSPDQPAAARGRTRRHTARLVATAVALALFAAAMWFAWLGWDDDYYLVDGVPQGPYRAWQVLGCGVSIAAAAVLASLRATGTWAVVVLAAAAVLGFAVPWSMDAASTDDSGLWVVGLVFLVVGGGIGLLVLMAITGAVSTRLPARRHRSDWRAPSVVGCSHPSTASGGGMGRSTDLTTSLACTGLVGSLPVTPESTTSRVVVNNPALRVVVFAFDEGELLTEHASPRAVVVHLLDGRIRFSVGTVEHRMAPGDVIYLAPGERHSLVADEPSHLSLVMVDTQPSAPTA